MRLGVDPRHADQMVRGTIVLPHGTGKTMRVAVIAAGEKIKEAETAGADIVGGDDLVERISGGFIEFDALVATPDMMKGVGRLGKILGPRGLMPNPKTGTVTFDITKAIREIKAGKVDTGSTRPASSTPAWARSPSAWKSSPRTPRRSSTPCRRPSLPRQKASTSRPSTWPRPWAPASPCPARFWKSRGGPWNANKSAPKWPSSRVRSPRPSPRWSLGSKALPWTRTRLSASRSGKARGSTRWPRTPCCAWP